MKPLLFAISLCLLVFLASLSSAQEICSNSNRPPLPKGIDDLRMYEKDFTLEQAMKSLGFLEKDVIEIIKKYKKTQSVLNNEGFYIGYPNGLTFVKGFLLKQEALAKKDKLEMETLRLKGGKSSKEAVSEAQDAFVAAKKTFCDFLKNAEYVD